MNRAVQVVKLGGSLLGDRQLVEQFARWHASGNVPTVLVVGGGRDVDRLRVEQTARAISDVEAHWLAIHAMRDNAIRLAGQLGIGRPMPLCSNASDVCNAHCAASIALVDPVAWMEQDASRASGAPLPCSWDVTSDSIAARIAAMLDCPRLVLLKSALPGGAATYSAAAASGYVDRHFPIAAAWFASVECINLRTHELASQSLVRD